RGMRRLGAYLETGRANRYDSSFSTSSQESSITTYGFVSIAPAVVARRPPLLPHCAAPHAVHVVSPLDLRRASRFLGIS
ncbi:hypothetical protein PISMIDRAFT_691019, partial [Pisolithus microcarpus 441]